MCVHDTFYVPSVKHNLLRIGNLNSKNYKTIFEGKFWKIYNNNGLVVKVPMIDIRMFLLRMESNVACFKDSIDESWIWHKRSRHLNFGSFFFHAKKKNLVEAFLLL